MATARTWVGTRFHHQAAVKGVGCDCRGLVLGVAMELGIEGASKAKRDPACNAYAKRPHADALRKAVERYLDPVPREAVALGDVLMMRFKDEPQHFAIVSNLDPMRIIHSFAQARRVVEHDVDDVWRARIVGAYRFRGLN